MCELPPIVQSRDGSRNHRAGFVEIGLKKGKGERLTFDVERDARSGKIKAENVRRSG
jgi:hypothetical protein